MNRFAAIIVLLTALSIGWVPVFASPTRLAAEMGATSSTSAYEHHADGCAGEHHCSHDVKQQHPAVCAACIGVPAIAIPIIVAEQPKIVVPRGEELPLVARDNAPLHRPPRI